MRWELDEAGPGNQQVLALADGGYDTNDIWNEVLERTTLLVRCAKNRAPYNLPGEGTDKQGRPRDYGTRLPRPDSILRQKRIRDKRTVLIRGRERTLQYRVVGPVLVQKAAEHPLYLVIVRGRQWQVGKRRRRTLRRKPAYYLVTAEWKDEKWELPLPIEDLLVWAWQRWEVEVAHREMKSSFGVGEKQCWGPRSALVSAQWGVWVYAALVLARYRTWGITGGPRLVGRWWRKAQRWFLQRIVASLSLSAVGQRPFSGSLDGDRGQLDEKGGLDRRFMECCGQFGPNLRSFLHLGLQKLTQSSPCSHHRS